MRSWGKHLIIDAFDCDADALRSKATIARFAKSLVKAIDMKAFGPPQIVKFGVGQTRGYTLVQLIETSNIMAHFSEDTNNIFLDVFSCKDFDPEVAIDVFCEFFDPTKIKTNVFNRG